MATAKKAQYFISLYVLDQNDRVAEDVFDWQRYETEEQALDAAHDLEGDSRTAYDMARKYTDTPYLINFEVNKQVGIFDADGDLLQEDYTESLGEIEYRYSEDGKCLDEHCAL